MPFIRELKRRNVFRVGVAYVVTAWLLIQVAETIFPLFGFDERPARIVVIVLAIGFIPALVFAWVFEFTPEGLRKESDIARTRLDYMRTHKLLDRVIMLVLGLGLAYFAFDKFVLDPARDELQIESATEQAVQAALESTRRFDNSALSIAVLPFLNLSSDPEQEYFSDGLSEEILNLLTKIQGLKVIARTSSFAYRGRNEDVRAIGHALGVKTLLDGSVRKSGDEVRITVALIDATDGSRIWSERYEPTMANIFEVQDSVAAQIIDALQVHVRANPTRGRPTDNTEAYTQFLKARVALNSDDLQTAEKSLLNAVELDPNFAEAYELLSYCYWYSCGGPVTATEGRRRTYDYAAQALAIDPNLVFAEAMYLDGKIHDFTYLDQLDAFGHALEKEPGNTNLLEILAWYLMLAGYLQEALEIAERYVELDPISPTANFGLVNALYAAGHTDEAIEALSVVEQLSGNVSNRFRGTVNLVEEEDDVAISFFEAALEKQGYADTSWVRELVTGARDPATGQAYLDRRIPTIVASMPGEDAFAWRETLTHWYLYVGFLDRYFEFIPDPATDPSDSVWSDLEIPVFVGTMYRQLGFTRHPRYIEVAESYGIVEAWEQRGPPDFCDKTDGAWNCE